MVASFSSLDLNLLRVFDAVMDERSVLRASQKLHSSHSAVSHSLARLRDFLGDELFVRTSSGMQPTAKAISMAAMVRQSLRSLEDAIETPSFDPYISRRRFTVAASDANTMIIVPKLLRILKADAPLVDIVIRAAARIDLAEQIDLGKIDAAVGTFSGLPGRFCSSVLFEYRDVLVTDASTEADMTMDTLAATPIAVVSFDGQQDRAVDGFLSERGLARRSDMFDKVAMENAFRDRVTSPRIAVSLPHFLAVPSLLSGTGLGAIVPRPLGELFAKQHPVAIHELPYPTSPVEVRALWHERSDGDPAQEWLRQVLSRATYASDEDRLV
jgi:DNA-binding transcriptional LysR family regulator